MRILFDQGTPYPLSKFLPEGSVKTAAWHGWSGLSNGDLIAASEEAGYDVLVTTDRNLRYQQNLANRKIAIAVVLQPAWPILKMRATEVAKFILSMNSGNYVEI